MPNALPLEIEVQLTQAQYQLRDAGYTEDQIAQLFRTEADKNRLARKADPTAELLSPHFMPAWVEQFLNPEGNPPPPDLNLEWIERLKFDVPACAAAERRTGLVWDSYNRLFEVFGLFNVNELTHDTVRHLHLAVRCGRDMLHDTNQLCAVPARAALPQQLAFRHPELPPLVVARVFSMASKKLWQLRVGAQLMADNCRSGRLKTAFLSAAQSLNRTEGALLTWLTRHGMAPWCMSPKGELLEPDGPTGISEQRTGISEQGSANSEHALSCEENRNGQQPKYQADTAELNHRITESSNREETSDNATVAPPVGPVAPPVPQHPTPPKLLTPPAGPRLNKQPPHPNENWY